MQDDKYYEGVAKTLLANIAEKVCAPCDDERKKKHLINMENPLLCGCSCEKVEKVISSARNILDDLKHPS